MSDGGAATFNGYADFQGNNIYLADNSKAVFGTGEDLQIYHDHANQQNKIISASLPVILAGTTVSLNNGANNENMLVATQDGSVDLYHNHVKKFETTASGVTVTGDIANASGTLTIDSASDIKLDADGSAIHLLDGGTHMGTIKMANSNINLDSQVADKDIIFSGNDGGSAITALTLDMSEAGKAVFGAGATFNADVHMNANELYFADNGQARFGDSEDLKIYHDGSNSYISDTGTGNLIIRGENLIIEDADGTNYLVSNANAETKLYHNGSKRLETTAAGVEMTGTIQSSSGVFQLDANDKIDINGTNIGFYLDGAEDMRLENDGDLHVEGDVIAYSTTVSDERLKDNIKVVDGALDKVKELKGVTFTRKQDGVESAGVIAQDVEKVLPQAVKHKALPLQTGNDELFKTVQYDALHALLIEAVKELSEKVEKLENK
jgi:hypothetical protein